MTDATRSRLLKFLALLLPLLLIFIFSQEFLFDRRNYDTNHIEKFYLEEENSLDVVLMGASEVTHGYTPGYAYEKYGFTSYKYSLDANQGSLYLSQLKEILKTQSPEILLVDLFGFMIDNEFTFFNSVILCNYSRAIPFSENKVRTIMQYPQDEKLSHFFPLILHHGHPKIAYERLLEVYYLLTKDEQPSHLKGALSITGSYSGTGDTGNAFDPLTYRITDSSKACLIEFLDYCQANDLNVVFTNFPRYIADEGNHNLLFMFNQTKSIVEQYGYPVWDLQAEIDAIGIDKNKDFYDPFHMNVYGQLKVTDYIGRKMIDTYGLTPRIQSEENKLEWEECATNTREYIALATDAIQTGKRLFLHENSYDWLYRNDN